MALGTVAAYGRRAGGSFARELDVAVVSNDRFKDRLAAFPDARERAIRYMIVNDEFVVG